jgi:hypothetical protein
LKGKKPLVLLILVFTLAFFISVNPAIAADNKCYSDCPRDIILQYKVSPQSGFSMMKLTAVPDFTLYGDGRVIYTRMDDNKNIHLYESKLTPDEMDQVIKFVIHEGIDTFNDNYYTLVLSDLDITTITLNTKDLKKTIKVYGFRLAAFQSMLPRGLVNISLALTKFQRPDECIYNPEKVSLFVGVHSGDLPDRPNIVKWKVSGINLENLTLTEPSFADQFKENVFTGKDKDNVLAFVCGNTLYENRLGFIKNFYKAGKCLFKIGYRPHLPYE